MNAPQMEETPQVVLALRDAILNSGLSLREIERRSGVGNAQLSRFLTGERSLTLHSAGRICEVLGLVLVGSKKRPHEGGEGGLPPLMKPKKRRGE